MLALAMLMALPVQADDEKKKKAFFDFSGFYAFNAYSQQNFFLGRTTDSPNVGGVSDNDKYSIQIFRALLKAGYGKNFKAVMRVDLAQGIWGIDNVRLDNSEPGFSDLFNSKDTNFLVHVDWAYVDVTHPGWNTNFKVGRQKYRMGNLLVLDQDNDGIQITQQINKRNRLMFGWSKMSEGADSLSDSNAIGPGGISTRDADIFILDYTHTIDSWKLNPYFAYYYDGSYRGGNAYIPDRLQYNKPRFAPQLTTAYVFGFSFRGTAGPVELKGEVDYLTGKDKIDNLTTNSGSDPYKLDLNNGDLSGYNLYADAKIELGPGKLGAVLGYGSGDDDQLNPNSKGNINKIRTNGFFYVTEVWEDSVMPDENGITPQGLGSPASRGYREFENSTLFQLNYSWFINRKWTLFGSGTWVKATEPIFAFLDADNDGTPGIGPGDDLTNVRTSTDLGWEIDLRATWKITQGLSWIFRGGYFNAGEASGFLINGTDLFLDNPYELRTTVKFSFGGIGVGPRG